jgi:hypothetical protein
MQEAAPFPAPMTATTDCQDVKLTPDEVAIALEATIAEPFTIPAALGRPPTAIPRYQAQVRPVLDRYRVKDYGKSKAARIDDGSGFPTFAELYVASRLRNAGWSCCWASVYQRLRFIDSWSWDAEKPILVSPPDDVFQVVAGIASIRQSATGRAKRSFGGLPDVIACMVGAPVRPDDAREVV